MAEATLRGYVYVVSGLILLGLGFFGVGWPYTLLLGSFVLASAYMSHALAEKYGDVLLMARVSRSLEREVGVEGEDVEVRIRVSDALGYGLPRVEVFDITPPRAVRRPGEEALAAVLPPKGVSILGYKARMFLGTHVFPGILLTAGDSFNLFIHTRRVEERSVVRMLPRYSGILSFMLRSRLMWPGETSRKRRPGHGIEFYELREYVPGDDPRKIVWTATARHGTLIVREDEVETRSRAMIFVDLSREMWIGPPGETSADHVSRAAVSIAAYLSRMGDQVGYIVFQGDRWLTRFPERGHGVVEDLANRISMISPEAVMGRIELSRALREAAQALGHGFLLVLSGVGFLRRRNLRILYDAVGGEVQCLAAVILPSPVDRYSRLVNKLELMHYRDASPMTRGRPLMLAVARGWEWMRSIPTHVEEVRLRYAY